jgi:hypothetical protein
VRIEPGDRHPGPLLSSLRDSLPVEMVIRTDMVTLSNELITYLNELIGPEFEAQLHRLSANST